MDKFRPLRFAATGVLLAALVAFYANPEASAFAVLLPIAVVFGCIGALLGHSFNQLAAAATTDCATGLPNRLAFERRFRSSMAMACRHGFPLSLLILDVDRLKDINDSRGHAAGDRALQDVAEALRRGLRLEDFAARWGGDEFVVLAPFARENEARACAARIRGALRALGSVATLSVGVATMGPGQGAAPTRLFEAADQALYAAKLMGRDRVVPGRLQ